MAELVGDTVGPYRILEPIGAGGMAEVFKAYQPSMERYVAIKLILPRFAQEATFLKRFQREARAVSRLEHAHILPVYDYGESEGRPYLVMRYMSAGTLKDRLSQGSMSSSEVNRVIGQVGSALDYAHRMGIIHRDVKPSNVLVDDEGNTYLTDFGLAKMMEASVQLTGTGVGIGTPAYMSPEQGRGETVDSRTDVYSLGVMLYEMVLGRRPYHANTPLAVVYKHIHEPLPLPRALRPDLPEGVERVILRALAKSPSDRFRTAGEMVQALDAAVRSAEAPEAARPAVTRPARPVVQWRRVALWAAPVVLVLLAVILAVWRPWARPRTAAVETVVAEKLEAATMPPSTPFLRPPSPEATATPAIVLAASATPRPTNTRQATAPTELTSNPLVLELAPGIQMKLVRVPAGEFLMGSADDDDMAEADELPQHSVYLDEFYIGRYEVTSAQFRAFVQATGYSEWRDIWDGADHPVVSVRWEDAAAFCRWASEVSGREVRLPTEAEWEKAARGTDGRRYPWGNEPPDASRCNFSSNVMDTRAVGHHSPAGNSPYGCADMAGNVWEWVNDWYDAEYYGRSPSGNPPGPESGSNGVLRGGGFINDARDVRAASRFEEPRGIRFAIAGFRICVSPSLTPEPTNTAVPTSTPQPPAAAAPSGIQVTQAALYEDAANCFAWSPDGKLLAIGGSSLKLYDVGAGEVLRQIDRESAREVAFSPDGSILATVGYEAVILWDVASWSKLRTLAGSKGTESVAFSPDGATLVTGTGMTVKVWEVATGKELRTIPGAGSVRSVAFSPDGQTVASAAGAIKLWDVTSGAELATLSEHSNWVNSVTFSPDGKTLASGSVDQTVRLWDVASGRNTRTLTGHTGQIDNVAFSPDGRLLASGSWDLTVRLWDVASGTELAALTGHTGWIHWVAFSPDGTMLASGSQDQMRLWGVVLASQ